LLVSYPSEHPDFDENDTLLEFYEHSSKDEDSISRKQLLKQPAFWVIIVLMFLGTSTGVVYFNIIGSIYRTLGAAKGSHNVSVLLLSVMNAVGRMSGGLITDKLGHKMKKTVYLSFIYLVMCGNWLALGLSDSLVILPYFSLVVGFCFGSTLCILPTITSELFGVCTFAENWGAIKPFNSLGGLALSFLAGHIYENQIPEGMNTILCVGRSCYSSTFYIFSALCLLSFVLSCYLTFLLPPVSGAHEHVIFPKLPHHIPLFRLSFLHPFHHHHTSRAKFKKTQGKRRNSHIEKHRIMNESEAP